MQDIKVNSRKVKIHVGNGLFMDKSWKEVSVGDIVKVNKNEYFPSDLLLLCSSYADGVCYVETMNLDGETNLKLKTSLEVTFGLDEDEEFTKFKAKIRCEDPNSNLYTFVGNLEFEEGGQKYPLSPTQILLRDSKLRNTDFVYGVVIYSGEDTKAVRNSTKSSPSKRSQIETRLDYVIYILFFMLILISLISSIGSTLFLNSESENWWYLVLREENVDPSFNPSNLEWSFCLQFVRALILYGYLIPISLYVSIEVVKVLQAMVINKDLKMFDEKTNKGVEARTSNLNEQLGQVEMILSDKTGTLTCNQMEFRKCSIEGISYGGEINEVDLAASRRMNIEVERYRFSMDGTGTGTDLDDSTETSLVEMFEFSVAEKANILEKNKSVSESNIKGFNFRDDRLLDKMWIYRSNVYDLVMFFRVMSLCHTGIIPLEEEENNNKKLNRYEAESPEEVAFLIAAQEFGFQFCKRTQSVMVLKEIDPTTGSEVMR